MPAVWLTINSADARIGLRAYRSPDPKDAFRTHRKIQRKATVIKRYNNLSLVIAIPGIILQIVGRVMMDGEQEMLGALITLGATGMVLVGFAFYAMAKGRSPVWCLAAFLSLIGLIILALLKDESGVDEV